MIYLSPLEDEAKIKQTFEEKNILFKGKPGCVTAVCGDKTLGFSLYEIENGKMTVHYIEPSEDIPLADGILRSTLHIAAERGIMQAFYGPSLSKELLKKTGFIKNEEQKLLNIDKLFMSCCDCEKTDKANHSRY